MKTKDHVNTRSTFLLFLMFLFVVIIYSNTLEAPFVFDDRHNILERSDLRMSRLTPETVMDTFFKTSGDSRRLYRPLSCLSFALNYYIGRYQVTGYHIVNLAIHLLTALFVFKTIILLFKQADSGFSEKSIVSAAALATLLWAAHPIQTQAVTYIVQRMALLAAMFFMAGLWAYLHFRRHLQNKDTGGAARWLAVSLTMFMAGLFSKENAAIFPAVILLVELFFFKGWEKCGRHPLAALSLGGVLLLAPLLIGLTVGFIGSVDSFLSGYDLRPFTLKQRLLTEPRVLFFYISQLLYPDPARFSLEHYMPLSDSLLTPLSTLGAIAGIGILLILALGPGRRYVWIGFPLAFYFVHHIVEGSVIPLEIVYEHRNYLPSVFFFLPPAAALVWGLQYYKQRHTGLRLILFVFTVGLLFFFGLATHIRNNDWRDPKAFWLSAIRVAPELCRPYQGLGHVYTHQESRDLDRAYALFRLGAEKTPGNFIFERALLWKQIAMIHDERRAWAQAETAAKNSLALYEAVITKRPDLISKETVRQHLADIYCYMAHLASATNPEQALALINQAMAYHDETADCHIARALYLSYLGNYPAGLQSLRQAIKKDADRWGANFATGHLLTLTGEFDRGHWFYKRSLHQARSKNDRYQSIYLYLAENRRLAGQQQQSDAYLQAYISQAGRNDMIILANRHTSPTPGLYPFVDTRVTLQQLADGLNRLGGYLENKSRQERPLTGTSLTPRDLRQPLVITVDNQTG